MNLAALALRNRTTTLVLTAVLLLGGVSSFNDLSRLEDPEFTIKEALVPKTNLVASSVIFLPVYPIHINYGRSCIKI